jgi:flagellum-specific peptidoglycan hydrolase FlgJ
MALASTDGPKNRNGSRSSTCKSKEKRRVCVPRDSCRTNKEYRWKANKKNLYNGCKEHNVALNTEAEIEGIFKAIQQVAKESKVDHRFILAEILQESTACVRVQTTKAPGDVEIFNPGLMQDHG